MDGSTTVPEATTGTTGSLGVEAGVSGNVLESGAVKPVVPEEQMALPEASRGMVGADVQAWSPLVVPRAVA